MFFSIPGFEPKTLTNDQLFEKQLELERKKVMSSRFGKAEMISQVQMMIDAIEEERRERMFQDVFGKTMVATQGLVVETDPDIRKEIEQEREIEETKLAKTQRKIHRPIRTLKPIKPNGGITNNG